MEKYRRAAHTGPAEAVVCPAGRTRRIQKKGERHMNKIKLIALDLDGTALTPQNKVAETTTDAVRRAREAGVHVVVSTGRICGEARDFAIDLDADDLMVTSGGATLSSISGEGCTMRMSMPWEAAVRAAAAVERIGMIAMIYVGETLLITPYDDLGFGSYKTNEGYLTSKKVVPSVTEYIADHHLSIDKIFVRSQDPVTLLRTRAILEQIPGHPRDELGGGQSGGHHPGRRQGNGARHAVPRPRHRSRSRCRHRRQRKRFRNAARGCAPHRHGQRIGRGQGAVPLGDRHERRGRRRARDRPHPRAQ